MTVPPVLSGLVETIQIGRRTGEWQLKLDERVTADAPLLEIVEPFLAAFPYARFSKIEYYPGEDADEQEWSAADGTPALELFDASGYGFDAELDLALFWEDGSEPRETVIPGGAQLFFTREVPSVTLTIWPNLFTDTVRLPTREPSDLATPQYTSELVAWPTAAARNRERLEASLRDWEHRSGGEIELWGTDRVEQVTRYGIPASAEPR